MELQAGGNASNTNNTAINYTTGYSQLIFKTMEFLSTKDMTNEIAPKGTVLVKYLEPSWGGWFLQYGMAYFDNPNDYEDPNDGEGWKHDNTGNKLNVVAYCNLPEINQEENPFRNIDQKQTKEKFGEYVPNLGNVGGLF